MTQSLFSGTFLLQRPPGPHGGVFLIGAGHVDTPSPFFIVFLTLWRIVVCGINDDDDDDGNDAVIITGSTVLKRCGPCDLRYLFTLLRRREQCQASNTVLLGSQLEKKQLLVGRSCY